MAIAALQRFMCLTSPFYMRHSDVYNISPQWKAVEYFLQLGAYSVDDVPELETIRTTVITCGVVSAVAAFVPNLSFSKPKTA